MDKKERLGWINAYITHRDVWKVETILKNVKYIDQLPRYFPNLFHHRSRQRILEDIPRRL